jgi:putative DNA primase/helicase
MGNQDFTAGQLQDLANGWGPLEELPVGLPPVNPFVYDLLPGALRPWIADIAERMQCPPDYPAVAAMVGLAAVVGRQLGIRPKARDDWTVVPNLWGAVIGRPALLKTPAIQEPLKMVAALETNARLEHEQGQKDYAAQELVRDALAKDAKTRINSAVRKGDNALAMAIATETVDTPVAPARRRYLTQDPTVEKLGELLRDNPRGILIYRDELVGFLRSMEIEGRENARAFYLEAWNGTGAHTTDRIQRGTVEVEAACVSIIGAIQPGPLRDYMLGAIVGGAGDDGMIQRFQLAVWPDAGREWVNVDRWPNTQARQEARAIFHRLDTLDPTTLGAQQDEGEALFWLRFDPEAQDIFNDWRAKLEFRLREDDFHPAMESHLAKFRSLVPSLALLAHLADDPDGGAVGVAALTRALAWSEYLESHARRIYSPALSPELFVALELAKRLPGLPEPFTARDVYQRHWRGLDMEGTRNAIQVLVDFNHLRENQEGLPAPGRPTVRYEVHPALRRTSP